MELISHQAAPASVHVGPAPLLLPLHDRLPHFRYRYFRLVQNMGRSVPDGEEERAERGEGEGGRGRGRKERKREGGRRGGERGRRGAVSYTHLRAHETEADL
eukprot:1710221-Rhodomonas_salina.1